jgi:hypothetical protein
MPRIGRIFRHSSHRECYHAKLRFDRHVPESQLESDAVGYCGPIQLIDPESGFMTGFATWHDVGQSGYFCFTKSLPDKYSERK